MKIVFMGTPDFAAAALEALVKAGHEVALAVTQPDKPKGRGREAQYPPVKICALKYGIPVFQPDKIKKAESVEQLRRYEAEIFVVAAFGQILSAEILDMPRFGCVNIHASLLPRYRGAAPIQWAILNGETETGVTIMQMDTGIDTGDMLAKKYVEITPSDTGESLHDKLMEAGAELIVETLPLIEAKAVKPEKQDDEKSCYAGMLSKSLGEIDWSRPAAELERLVRGLNPWPSAFTRYNGRQLKIWEAQVKEASERPENGGNALGVPGTVAEVTKDAIGVQTGQGILFLKSVQPEGKKKMQVKDFLLGYRAKPGDVLGGEN